MLGVLFKLIVMQPEVLLTHVKNYADLAVEELQHAFVAWRLRALLYVVSALLLGLGVLCGLMSLLLWGALPVLHPDNAWVMVALPLVLLVAGFFVGMAAQRHTTPPLFAAMQEQLDLDMLAIGQVQTK
jgi:uncharacterized membrane protein YqjE